MNAPTTAAMLDTAIPMCAAGAAHAYRDACRWVMTEIAECRLHVVIDAEVVQEILHRYGALGRHAEAVSAARALMIIVAQVLPGTASDMHAAIALFQQFAPQGVRARDTIHAAVMRTHGLTHIISSDAHFDLLPGIVRLDPIALHQGARLTP